jgi:hypothetical protein
MENWRRVWRDGISPALSTPGLAALRDALRSDDPALLQGCTTSPPPLACVQDWPVEGACLVGLCGWRGDGLETVAEVEDFFCNVCMACDAVFDEPAACRWLLNWYDETSREEMRALLLPEVELAISARKEEANAQDAPAA